MTATCQYDYLDRRVEQRTNYGSGIFSKRYIWDGWNVIADVWSDWGMAVGCTYVWGLDVSGTVGGAGGVGGLAVVYYNSRAFLPLQDGRGNIYGYLDTATRQNAVAWDFTPFGETLYERGGQSGVYGTWDFPFRYQSKMQDTNGQLLYFGLRYYHPGLGRFINRDPAGEAGGINLHAYVGNNPANLFDYLGLRWTITGQADYQGLFWWWTWDGGADESQMFSPGEMRIFRIGVDPNTDYSEDDISGWEPIVRSEGGEQEKNEGSSEGGGGSHTAAPNNTEKELPPCSQFLKNGLTLTGQAFIMDETIPYIPGQLRGLNHRLRGDNRGFLDAPASSQDGYRLSNTATLSSSGESRQIPRVGESIQYDETGAIVRRATATGGQHGAGHIWPKYLVFGHDTYQISLYSSVGEPFDSPLSDMVAPIRMSAHTAFDPRTGYFEGNFYTSGFPSFQFFLNGESILNVRQGDSPWNIVTSSTGNHVSIQVCDPTK